MQTIIMTTILIALSLLVINQHLALKKLYKVNRERNERQDTINSAFSTEISRLKANAKPRQPVKLPELPPFIKQPQTTRYFMEVEHNAN